MPNNTVVITGFGPFGTHPINASWEAVKLLPNKKINADKVVIEEMSVEYKVVDQVVPNLWKTHDPKLVVHVGATHLTTNITLETQAFRAGYTRLDRESNLCPSGEVCLAKEGSDCLQVSLDVEKICAILNSSEMFRACTSINAQRYVCEYTLYKSLSINKDRALFVHVPHLNKPYDAQELAAALILIINCALEQL